MNPNIELTEKSRKGVVKILDALLVNKFVLGTRTRNVLWNVTDPDIHDLHKLSGVRQPDR